MAVELLRYEFPATEKIRTFLRLSTLFKQLEWYAQQDHMHDHQAALDKYFEIQEVTNRGDQKNDILQELERVRVYLAPLSTNPNIDQDSLKKTLDLIQERRNALNNVGIRISHLSSQNDFLKQLSQRSSMPAATCEFDAPLYHHWLNSDPEMRKAHLKQWIEPFRPYREAIDLILGLLRGNAETTDAVAVKGAYQKDLQGKNFSLTQIYVDPSLNVIPNGAANRYLLTVRFIPVSFDTPVTSNAVAKDIPFQLSLCNI
ncbi:MAG: cell division protein ZapD [Burkholderiales bacterium]|nr:cell division protein ZapD [Burkholderiales bacterium]